MVKQHNLHLFILIVAKILAWKDFWIVGDDFAWKIYDALQRLHTEAATARSAVPYIYEFYNVECYTVNREALCNNVMANLINAVLKGLNDKILLPLFILVVPDYDLVKYFNHFVFGVSLIAGKCLNYVINEIDRAIESRKDALRRRKPGAVSAAEPKVIWVKMINRYFLNDSRCMEVRGKFNRCLENILANKRNHYIIDVSKHVYFSDMFYPNGDLNPKGKTEFWSQVDAQLEAFDKQKLSLRPVAISNVPEPVNDSKGLKQVGYSGNNKDNFRLPPPPPTQITRRKLTQDAAIRTKKRKLTMVSAID